MVSAKAVLDLNVSADEIWQLIGGFGSLPEWTPNITQTELSDGGRVRHLRNPKGQSIVEKLERYDFSARSYSYSIVKGPFPVAGYLATLSVTPIAGGTGSHVEWTATFTPVGASDEETRAIFHGIFSSGLRSLEARYAGKRQPS
jgi:hypothetical protein